MAFYSTCSVSPLQSYKTMVKFAKRTIYATLSISEVTNTETLFNSWPLAYQSADPKDDTPLALNHFLHGPVGGQIAPERLMKVSIQRKIVTNSRACLTLLEALNGRMADLIYIRNGWKNNEIFVLEM